MKRRYAVFESGAIEREHSEGVDYLNLGSGKWVRMINRGWSGSVACVTRDVLELIESEMEKWGGDTDMKHFCLWL